MSDYIIEIDVKALASRFKEIQKQVEKALNDAIGGLAASTHARALELANEKLNSLSEQYKDALSFEHVSDNIWVVSLNMDKAGFIEAGRSSGFQRELLNGKSAKTNLKGEKYAVIPFHHNKSPSKQTVKAQNYANQIKSFLKEKNIDWKKLEFNSDGSPKLGLLHKFDIPSEKPTAKASHPALSGVAIYQKKNEKGKVEKSVMTFRVITEQHEKDGRWFHPGLKGVHIIDECYKWALDTWDSKILPAILEKFK